MPGLHAYHQLLTKSPKACNQQLRYIIKVLQALATPFWWQIQLLRRQ